MLTYIGPLTRVVALSKATKQARGTCCANDTSVLLLPEMWPRRSCAFVCSLDVDLHHQIPVLVFHVLEADVAKDAGVVDEDINPAKGLDGSLDDPVAILDGVVVCDGFTASGCDLFDDLVGSLGKRVC
jgi:hypothetical protein